jgi:hypothetical protein
LLLFLEKEEYNIEIIWEHADPQGRLHRVFCEAEQRFLLLFLEKEEYSIAHNRFK